MDTSPRNESIPQAPKIPYSRIQIVAHTLSSLPKVGHLFPISQQSKDRQATVEKAQKESQIIELEGLISSHIDVFNGIARLSEAASEKIIELSTSIEQLQDKLIELGEKRVNLQNFVAYEESKLTSYPQIIHNIYKQI